MNKSRINVWSEMLSDLNSEHILAAGYHIISNGEKFPPPVGEVRRTAKRIERGSVNPPSALESWERVMMKVRQKDIELTRLEKKALSRIGSIYDLRRSENMSFDRAAYIKSFEEILQSEEKQMMTMPNVLALAAASGNEAKMLKG